MPDQTWECGWERHRLAQLRRLAQLPFWQKLEWLEEAQELAEHLQSARRQAGENGPGPVPARPVSPEASGPKTS